MERENGAVAVEDRGVRLLGGGVNVACWLLFTRTWGMLTGRPLLIVSGARITTANSPGRRRSPIARRPRPHTATHAVYPIAGTVSKGVKPARISRQLAGQRGS